MTTCVNAESSGRHGRYAVRPVRTRVTEVNIPIHSRKGRRFEAGHVVRQRVLRTPCHPGTSRADTVSGCVLTAAGMLTSRQCGAVNFC